MDDEATDRSDRLDRMWEILIETRTEVRSHINSCSEREQRDRAWRRQAEVEREHTRKLILRFSWSMICMLLAIIGWLLVNGAPWALALKGH